MYIPSVKYNCLTLALLVPRVGGAYNVEIAVVPLVGLAPDDLFIPK